MKLRRAQLARIVKGVVVASVILCVAAIASAVVRATTKGDGAEDSPPRAAMKAREAGPMAAVITMRESIDALSDRTRTALAREQRRSAAHAMTASRGRSFW